MVLILVLVDVGLGLSDFCNEQYYGFVLILVLVDVGLGPVKEAIHSMHVFSGLNPCFSGCWSRTAIGKLPLLDQ